MLQKIDSARAAGLAVSANMYTYPAASTGLDATLPPWVQEGGKEEGLSRLRTPETRQQVLDEMRKPAHDWENFYQMAGSPDNIMLVGFDKDSLKYLAGKTLAEAALSRNTDPAALIIDLILANEGDVDAIYFLMSEENVEKQIRLPYMSFGSDAGSVAAEGKNLESSRHPRAYGNFARLLARYVREKQLISLEEAIMKMTALPAQKLKIKNRGRLASGYYADVVVFDPAAIQDKATFENPHQYATGMLHVFVNGQQVLKDGAHTGATPGRVVRGPGYKKEP